MGSCGWVRVSVAKYPHKRCRCANAVLLRRRFEGLYAEPPKRREPKVACQPAINRGRYLKYNQALTLHFDKTTEGSNEYFEDKR